MPIVTLVNVRYMSGRNWHEPELQLMEINAWKQAIVTLHSGQSISRKAVVRHGQATSIFDGCPLIPGVHTVIALRYAHDVHAAMRFRRYG